jgi:hypothetical protein
MVVLEINVVYFFIVVLYILPILSSVPPGYHTGVNGFCRGVRSVTVALPS